MVYLLIGAAGTIVSWYYSLQRGLWDPNFMNDALANTAAASQGADLFTVSALAFVWILAEGKRCGVRHRWRFILVLYVVSASAALAWFFWERSRSGARIEVDEENERQREHGRADD